MALVTGPLFSVEASGQFAKTMVFAKWKGRQYVREYVIPTNPKSAAQVANRVMMGFLSSAWKNIGTTNQASWLVRAQANSYSTFNAYTSVNMDRWSEYLAPGQIDPPNGTGTLPTLGTTVATGGVGTVNVNNPLTVPADCWGGVLFMSTTAVFTPTKDLIVAVSEKNLADELDFTLNGLAPGTYYFQVGSFTDKGNQAFTSLSEVSAVVT